MLDWSSDLFAKRRPWQTYARGPVRRPKPLEPVTAEADPVESAPPPLAEDGVTKPQAQFKKAGWVEDVTKFGTDAALFAEFDIPKSESHRTRVDFQVLRRQEGKFIAYATAQGTADSKGRATAKAPIRKDQANSEDFRIQARHGAGEWSDGKGTDREVTETAPAVFEHDYVSGLHFPRNSSFIVPGYLKVFRDLEKSYGDWKKTHPQAKIVVFGHAERDEEDPPKLSARRAQIAFAFLIGDYDTWGRFAREERWGHWEHQHILASMNFYKGGIDGTRGPKMDTAIREFITWLNESECKGINPDLGLTEEYIRLELYRVYVTGKKRAVTMPSGNFRTVSCFPYVGCRSFNRYKGGDGHHAENRRAGFLLIEENANFPAPFPCKSNAGPCEKESAKDGERSIKGFQCKFYDGLMKKEVPSHPNLHGTLEKSKGKFDRISFDGYSGQGYVIKDFRKYESGAIQLRPDRIIIAAPTPIPAGFKNECASFVQFFDLPHTSAWRKGPRVCDLKPGSLPEGTVVATLRDNKYHSDYSGRSHVGIYLIHDEYQEYLEKQDRRSGVQLMDQYNGKEIRERKYYYSTNGDAVGKPARKPWVDGDGNTQNNRVEWMKDGEEYYVLLV